MTVTVNDVLKHEVPAGVYSTRTRVRPDTIRRAVEQHAWRFFHLDGHAIYDKATFLGAIARAMAFPTHFGQNWDALSDSICDLSWVPAPGYLLLYDHVTRFTEMQPDAWAIARDILSDAARSWQEQGVPFYVLLRE